MNISYNWLKDFIDLELGPEETAEKLTLIGLEVESVEEYGSSLDGVIVGEVLDVSDHPNADRLRICKVDTGSEKLQIICGADNVAKGQKVPVATVGTTLPVKLEDGSNLKIKKAKLRGEESKGMICAEDELGLGTDHDGIMVLDENLKIGKPVNEIFDLYTDYIFDIAITPNRPDATCHLGVARDLAAALNLDLKKPYQTEFEDQGSLSDFEISIKNPKKCPRYVGKIIRDVTIEESPKWLKDRLKAIGVRPVNNVVDATNYVMYEMGQPLHAFDMNTLKGNQIIVRDYEKEISFETLDHVKRDCSPGTLFICDAEEPVAIAGIMGGVDSEVSDDTSDILLESAYFDPGTIRKTAKEQTLQTDASYRFERGIDPEMQRTAAEHAAKLIADLTGGNMEETCSDVHPKKAEIRELNLRKSYVNRLLGTEFDIAEIDTLLNGLELEELDRSEDAIHYRIPTFRPDLEREVDLIEEVGRLYDYNNIEAPKHTRFTSPEPINDWEKLKSKAKRTASGLRFREIYSNSLMPDKDAELLGDLDEMIHTLNPISTDMTTLRPSLLYGFLKSVAYNFNRNAKGVRFFEVGNVFEKAKSGTYHHNIQEETNLLMGLAGFKHIDHWKTEPELYDIFDLKASLHSFLKQFVPEESINTSQEGNELHYSINDKPIGRLFQVDEQLLEVYEIKQPAFTAEISLSRMSKALESAEEKGYEPVPKFPSFDFDFAVIVDADVPAGKLLKTIEEHASDSLKELDIFDVFEGESLGKNKKSLAFRLSFVDKNKTLTINEVEPIIEKVLKALDKNYSAKLRS
ncbi:phenylalanine--tRNA ligase subunit beta [Balneolaceae bacterium YR4-1]|uniref:Phenylalanine--tRNA ligase beta subunit n=1 Tax=Halalkalibaculum roseum TaxID=2709311 RepID=A0A6M1T1H3_9BACT|nr:phenylalanine--tRNA ligase subunit beta [Halalkalibaculum roseum]NGP76597.1 phenylalanine--tRNA ligase subunit beta [Halalkalibaculum roseum]